MVARKLKSRRLAEAPPHVRSLREMADDAVNRMTPGDLALYEAIGLLRDGFGAPVDVNSLVREVKEDA